MRRRQARRRSLLDGCPLGMQSPLQRSHHGFGRMLLRRSMFSAMIERAPLESDRPNLGLEVHILDEARLREGGLRGAPSGLVVRIRLVWTNASFQFGRAQGALHGGVVTLGPVWSKFTDDFDAELFGLTRLRKPGTSWFLDTSAGRGRERKLS